MGTHARTRTHGLYTHVYTSGGVEANVKPTIRLLFLSYPVAVEERYDSVLDQPTKSILKLF